MGRLVDHVVPDHDHVEAVFRQRVLVPLVGAVATRDLARADEANLSLRLQRPNRLHRPVEDGVVAGALADGDEHQVNHIQLQAPQTGFDGSGDLLGGGRSHRFAALAFARERDLRGDGGGLVESPEELPRRRRDDQPGIDLAGHYWA